MNTQERAVQAKLILDNPLFEEAIESCISRWKGEWERSAPEDTNSREIAYNRVKAIQEVRRELIRLLNAKKIIESKYGT